MTEKFEKLGIGPSLLKSIQEMGFTEPTEIQEKAIPLLLESEKDFVGQAQTGTGKTAAFLIPILEKINLRDKDVQALVLVPTRELAKQVETEAQKLGKNLGVNSMTIYGGSSYEKQIRPLKKGRVHLVVGTPGRVIDLVEKGVLKLERTPFCVLDEADEMLNMGFLEDIDFILGQFPKTRQLLMFSATMSKGILSLIEKRFQSHHIVKTQKKISSHEYIEQKYFLVKERYFLEALTRLIDHSDEQVFGMVFCQTKNQTRQVGEDLKSRGYPVEVLHGDMGQKERELAMKRFKEKKASLMVCTDVAARGIDVNDLTHVFQYGLPQDFESYVHRIGRTGRAGMSGKAFTLTSPKREFVIKKIGRETSQKIGKGKLPSIEELKKKVVSKELSLMGSIREALERKGDEFEVDPSFSVFEEGLEGVGRNDLMKLIFTWKFNKTMRQYENLGDIEGRTLERKEERGRRERRAPRGRKYQQRRNPRRSSRRGKPNR